MIKTCVITEQLKTVKEKQEELGEAVKESWHTTCKETHFRSEPKTQVQDRLHAGPTSLLFFLNSE